MKLSNNNLKRKKPALYRERFILGFEKSIGNVCPRIKLQVYVQAINVESTIPSVPVESHNHLYSMR